MTERPCDEQAREQVFCRTKEILSRVREHCRLCGRSPEEVTVMAVTKTVPPALVNEAVKAGISLLGENRVQEFLEKTDSYAAPAANNVHFIGRLQRNKVKYIVDKVTMVESLDSLSLAEEISRQCEKHHRTMDCLVEVNIGGEHSKSGISPPELDGFLEKCGQFPHLQVKGLMCIPPISQDETEIRNNFLKMRELFVDNRGKNVDNVSMSVLSMGMSEDYLTAIACGATQVRLGTALFGRR